MTDSKNALALMQAFFEEADLNHRLEESQESVRFEFKGRIPQICRLRFINDFQLLVFESFFGTAVTDAALPELEPYLAFANYLNRIGHHRLRFEDYRLRYFSSIPIHGVQLSKGWILNLIMPSLFSFDYDLIGIVNILFENHGAEQAVEARMSQNPEDILLALSKHFDPITLEGRGSFQPQQTLSLLQQGLDHAGIPYHQSQPNSLNFSWPGKFGGHACSAILSPEDEHFSFQIPIPLQVPAGQIPTMIRTLFQINELLPLGCFDINDDTGAIRFRHHLFFKEIAPSAQMLLSIARSGVNAVDQYLDQIRTALQ